MVILDDLNKDRLNEYLVPAEDLKRDLSALNEISNFHKSAFVNELIDVFYEQPIALIDDFTLERQDEQTFLDGSSIGRISFSLYIPYDSSLTMDSGEACTCDQPLPEFYPKGSCGTGA